VSVKRALDAHCLRRTHDEFDVKLGHRLNEWNAIEPTITVDAVDLDELACSGNDSADGLPQRAGVIRLDRLPRECEPNSWIDDTEGEKRVGEVRSTVWIDFTDMWCLG
jgi:hypothetical protein